MNIPENVKLYEHAIATFWFDEDGILYSVSKKVPRDVEVMKDYVIFVKKMLNNNKACILSDISNAAPMDKNTRDYIETELKNVYKAMALISKSPLGIMIANIYLKLNTPSFPTKMFANVKDGKNWLKQYL
ncbi:MAG: STAS/SEC14 domain-containing protein [Bacteroidetes bacterium]|nr:STAS/SEC14 domain-containing protein [Bacteroidota bacterium]